MLTSVQKGRIFVVELLLLIWAMIGTSLESFSARKHHESHPHDHFSLGRIASGGFFADITNRDWILKENIHCNESFPALQRGAIMTDVSSDYWSRDDIANYWFVTNEPTFTCGFEQKIGSRGDGGKWVCDPHRIERNCLVYSVGSNNQYDFEDAIYAKLHCEIHTFDPTVKTPTNKTSTFWRLGLRGDRRGNQNQNDNFPSGISQSKLRDIGEIVDMLGHSGRQIDIFKIDCEGCEFQVISKEFFDALRERNTTIRQIQMELHSPLPSSYDNEGRIINKEGIRTIETVFHVLRDSGYRIFHKEPNVIADNYGRCVEYAFIHVDPLPETENCEQVQHIHDFHWRGGGQR